MGRLKLLETDSPLEIGRESTANVAAPPVGESTAAHAAPTPARKPRKRSPKAQATAAATVNDGAIAEVDGPRCDLPVLLVPQIWREIGQLAHQLSETGQRVSRNALVLAILQSAMPRDADAATNLVRRWRLLRASEEWPLGNEPNLERKLRVHMSQRAQLDEYAQVLQDGGVTRGRSMLVNAILYFEGPKDLQDAGARYRRWETMLAGR